MRFDRLDIDLPTARDMLLTQRSLTRAGERSNLTALAPGAGRTPFWPIERTGSIGGAAGLRPWRDAGCAAARAGVAELRGRRAHARHTGECKGQQNHRVGPLTGHLLTPGMGHPTKSKTRDIHRSPHAVVEPPAPASAARQAAEAAFAALPMTAAAPAVPVRIVSVRRKSIPATVRKPTAQDVAAEAPRAKTPRVFRLTDTQSQRHPVASEEALPQEPVRRRRHFNPAQRPGPVHVVACPQALPDAQPVAAPAGPALAGKQLEALRRMLRDLEQTFAQIRAAQAFRIELPTEC